MIQQNITYLTLSFWETSTLTHCHQRQPHSFLASRSFFSDMQLMNFINVPTRPLSYSCLDLILVPVTMAPGVHMDNTTVSFLYGATDHHQITSNIVLTSTFRNPQVHDMTIDDAVTFWQRSLKTVVDTHCPQKLPPIPTQPPPLP